MLRLFFLLFLTFQCIPAFSQDIDAELVYHQTDIFLKRGKLVKNISCEIKICNRGGEKFTKVTIPYSKLIKVSGLEAFIKDDRGRIINKLQKSDITDRSVISENSLYEDDYVKEFTLKHNTYPYSIVYKYQSEEEEFLNIEYWVPVIDIKVPTHKAILNLEVPVDYKISFKSQFSDLIKADTVDFLIKYSWETTYKNIIEPEIYSADILSFLPSVKIVPDDFLYNKRGSFESWQTFGNWHYDLLEGLSDLPLSEKISINNVIEGIVEEREKVNRLYKYLQDNTRYINITIETGGLKPYPASYVSQNKFGDCKALSNYFKAVLDYAGIQSFYTKVNAGNPKVQIDKKFPSQQFNHIILCVPVQNDTIWLDCTSDGAFNHLGTFTQDRDVFLIEKDMSHFTRTPSLSFDEVLEKRRVQIKRNLQKQAIAVFSNTYRGRKYESLFYLSRSVTESDKSQIFQNHFAEDGFELIDLSISDSARNSPEISVTYSAKSDKVYKDYGKDLMIDIMPFSIPRFENPKKRKLPVQIDYPIYKTDTLEYEIPAGYSMISNFINQEISCDFGRYHIESVHKDKKLLIMKSFLLHQGEYPIDRYTEFYEFIKKVTDFENSYIIITRQS